MTDAKSEAGDLDLKIYSLEKFLRLATQGNPNVLELLFITGDSLLECNEMGAELRSLASSIVSRAVGKRYLGYLEAQRQRLLGERGQMKVTRTDLIEEFGYDTKYLSHVLRLGFQGVELLETGKLVLPMEGGARDIVLRAKKGEMSLNEGLNLAGDLEQQIKDLVSDGPVRETPNILVVEAWMRDTYRKVWENNRGFYADVATRTVQ